MFKTKINTCEQLLSLARNPFFLSQMVDILVEDVNVRLVPIKARLAQHLVHSCIQKRETETTASRQRDRDLAFSVLPYVARWAIEAIGCHRGEVLPSSVFSDEPTQSRFSRTELLAALECAEAYGLLTTSGLLAGRQDLFGYPAFTHDFVRDYFAAHYLLLHRRLSQVPRLESILEYREWDGALEMYYGLIHEPRHLQEDLSTLAKWDLFVAAHCLACCPVADESSAQQLLRALDSPRTRRLYRANEFPPDPFSIRAVLSYIFSKFRPETLTSKFLIASTPDCLRDAIPAALGMALGEDAFPYLQEFVNSVDLCDCEFAYMELQRLATCPAWELLTTKYIDLAEHPGNEHMILQMTLFGTFKEVPPNLVMNQIAKARREMKLANCTEFRIDQVVRTIACALSHVGPEYANDLLMLEKCSDAIVSEQASAALLRMKHPSAIQAALQRVRRTAESLLQAPGQLARDLRPLCELNDPRVNTELWRLLEINLESHSSDDWSHIPYALALRADRDTLEHFIRRCLSLDSMSSLESMKAFSHRVPDVVLPILIEQASEARRGTSIWHRLIAFQACCGDASVRTDLAGMLADIQNVRWMTDTEDMLNRMRAPTINAMFQAFVIDMVGKLEIAEALPALRNISRREDMPLVSARAADVLVQTFWRQVHTRQRAAVIVKALVAYHKKDDSPIHDWYRLTHYAATWPPEILKYFLHELRDQVEKAICRKRSPVIRLYTLIALLRNELRQRHLDLFRN
jgi:hypothetical protein